MKLKYDFHIHTALSPCSEDTMTPNNIINMALLNELDAIAITDHNSCENVDVMMELGKRNNLLVIPGMEIETREEIHVVCLFPGIEEVYNIQKTVYARLPQIKNKKKIFGEQCVFNEEDDIINKLDRLLAFATDISLEELYEIVEQNNGLFIPAHIDRPSYSIISNLGMIPHNMNLNLLEISRYADYETYRNKYPDCLLLQSSDAHDLGHIGICQRELHAQERSIQSIFEALSTNIVKKETKSTNFVLNK